MKIKLTIAALFLSFLPGLAAAMCSSDHIKTSSQCAEGQVWDAAKGTCTAPLHG